MNKSRPMTQMLSGMIALMGDMLTIVAGKVSGFSGLLHTWMIA